MENTSFRSTFTSGFRIAYTWFLPLIIAIALLIVSSKDQRSPFLGSWTLDFFTRIYLTLVLSAGLVFLPKSKKLRRWFYGKDLSSTARDSAISLFTVFGALLYGVFAALIIWWIIQVFLPSLANISMIIAILSGFIYAIPVLTRGKDFVP